MERDNNERVMAGDGQPAPEGAEAAYGAAKTSVWWDIENCPVPRLCNAHAIAQNICSALVKMNYRGPTTISAYGDTTRIPFSVQHALSGTGIALNHVPAGAKDASDKKILVDMLFWAVDNPAPANYLLISGDRDFSNALHQLRMRRYNILLAQPVKASAALAAAAKYVWQWTTLLNGGLPYKSADGIIPASNSVYVKNVLSNQLAVQKSTTPARDIAETANTAAILTNSVQESKDVQCSHPHTECKPVAKHVMKAPHEFFGAISSAVGSSNNSIPNAAHGSMNDAPAPPSRNSNVDNSHDQMAQLPYAPESSISRNNNSTVKSVLSRPEGSNDPISNHQSEENSCLDGTTGNVTKLLSSQLTLRGKEMDGNENLPSQYVQGLIAVIFRSLNTLKVEKIVPTEENIIDCVRYGDPKYRKTDVKKALKCGLDQEMIVKRQLGNMELYIGRIERLWPCENPIGGTVGDYPKSTWDSIHSFITSSAGRLALLASECRYDAALILQKSCLKTLPLGEVLRILNMIITTRQWIKIANLGWQPIMIDISETKHDIDTSS